MAAKKKSTKRVSDEKSVTAKKAPKKKQLVAAKKPAKTKKILATMKAPKKSVAATKAPKKSARAKAAAAPKRALTTKRPVEKAAAAKVKANAKPTTKTKPPIARRDGSGHLDKKYAAELRARMHPGDRVERADTAFLRGPRSADSLAEELGESAVETMTSAENDGQDVLDQVVDEEAGGPFIETSGAVEFADDTDSSNPKGATREPFPLT